MTKQLTSKLAKQAYTTIAFGGAMLLLAGFGFALLLASTMAPDVPNDAAIGLVSAGAMLGIMFTGTV